MYEFRQRLRHVPRGYTTQRQRQRPPDRADRSRVAQHRATPAAAPPEQRHERQDQPLEPSGARRQPMQWPRPAAAPGNACSPRATRWNMLRSSRGFGVFAFVGRLAGFPFSRIEADLHVRHSASASTSHCDRWINYCHPHGSAVLRPP